MKVQEEVDYRCADVRRALGRWGRDEFAEVPAEALNHYALCPGCQAWFERKFPKAAADLGKGHGPALLAEAEA